MLGLVTVYEERLMGHATIATTTRYLHLSVADLTDAVDSAFPAP